MTRRATGLPLAALAVLATGCGITNPYQSTHSNKADRPAVMGSSTATTTTTPADAGDPALERGGTIPPNAQAAQNRLAAGAGLLTPRAALERYASLYINWQASNLANRQRELASISLGQARAQALQAAASAARDPELTRSHVADQGVLIALILGAGSAAGNWVLVTREHTTGQGDYAGLPPTLHVTYAIVAHTTAGWVVSSWKPQD
jgi:hypothetical protein